MLQQAVANGLTTLDFLIQAEENYSNVDGRLTSIQATKRVQRYVLL